MKIGDRVTYCLLDAPDRKLSVALVEGASNASNGFIHAETPLALALLGLSPGDTGILEMPDRPARKLRVLEIRRRDESQV